MKKLAVVLSHPIQHFCPMYANWAKNSEIHLKVFFISNVGSVGYFDSDFNVNVQWANLYLNEFDHIFLNGDNSVSIDENLDALNLESELDSYNPDVVIQYGHIYRFNKRLRLWARRMNVKLGYVSDSELSSSKKKHIFKNVIKRVFYTLYFLRVDFVLSVGDSNEEFYLKCKVPRNKIIRMNFSIDVRNYDKQFPQKKMLGKALRESLGIHENDLVLSVVGKLVEWKSQIDLIKLLQLLENSYPEIRYNLLIAGSGPMEMKLRNMALNLKSNKVHFMGFVQPINLIDVYAATDIYVHPAKKEPHSLAISEAIYMGNPIILADTCGSYGPTDDVIPGENGFVYKHGDIRELLKFIRCLSDLELRQEFSNKSIQLSRSSQLRSHFGVLNDIVKI